MSKTARSFQCPLLVQLFLLAVKISLRNYRGAAFLKEQKVLWSRCMIPMLPLRVGFGTGWSLIFQLPSQRLLMGPGLQAVPNFQPEPFNCPMTIDQRAR